MEDYLCLLKSFIPVSGTSAVVDIHRPDRLVVHGQTSVALLLSSVNDDADAMGNRPCVVMASLLPSQ